MTDQTAVAEVPYVSITIQGLQFDVAQPYNEGHALTAGEASQLNQVRAENIRNNFASTVKAAVEAYRKANNLPEDAEVPTSSLDADDLAEKLSKYDDEYVMGVRGGPSGPRTPIDPVQREAYKLAMEKIKVALKKKGIKIDSVSKEQMGNFIQGTLSKYPEILEMAKRRVKEASELALDGLEI